MDQAVRMTSPLPIVTAPSRLSNKQILVAPLAVSSGGLGEL